MTNPQNIVKAKVGLLELAKPLGHVRQACKIIGYGPGQLLSLQGACRRPGGSTALMERSRRQPHLRNRVAPEIEDRVVTLAVDEPARGQKRVANELAKAGIPVSPAGVRTIGLRHDLQTMKRRLKAGEAKVAQDGRILTESQLAALEKARADRQAHGEFASECPGYGGAQDTFNVGTMKAMSAP